MRWLVIGAPAVAGIVLLIFGTAGGISVAFGITLIGITALIWMSNWFIRMSFDDHGRERETQEREARAVEQGLARKRAKRAKRTAAHRDAPRRLGGRRRRPL